MIPGLSAADDAAYRAALATHCEVRYRIHQLDLSHQFLGGVDTIALEGQINLIEATADNDKVTRTLQASFLDPDRVLQVDGSSPAAGVGGRNRLLQIWSMVHSEAESRWITAPAGVFRPSDVGRDGDVVTIDAEDKMSIHLRNLSPFYIRKGTNRVTAIKDILTRAGETRFRFPTNYQSTLGANVHVGGPKEERQPGPVAHSLAKFIDLQLYWDLTGYACLRPYPPTATHELHETGPQANTLTRIKTGTNFTDTYNRVVITGRTKSNHTITGVAEAPASHPLSARNQVQNGHDQWDTLYEDASDLHTQREVDARAQTRLTEVLTEQTTVETTTLPFWHFESMDRWTLHPATGDPYDFRPANLSAPLLDTSATGMSVGYVHKVASASAGNFRR